MRSLEEATEGPNEQDPLAGRAILVTRPAALVGALSRRLRGLGARVFEVPTIRIEQPPDPLPMRRAVASLDSYDWLVVTSVNGVEKLTEAMEGAATRADRTPGLRTAAIGPETARRLGEAGFANPLVPRSFHAEGLLEAILATAGGSLAGQRVLLPRAQEARELLPEGLRHAGAEVDVVAAYVTVPAEEHAPDLRRRLAAGVDWITFTSSSTVRCFAVLAGASTGGARVAAIGPIAAATARELGMSVEVVAAEHTIPGLVRALVEAEGAARPAGGGG